MCAWWFGGRRARALRHNSIAPIHTIEIPDTIPRMREMRSGITYREMNKVAIPRTNTLAVCVKVTLAPSNAACFGAPRAPTRYAATIVLPWPGSRACKAPNQNARARSVMNTGREIVFCRKILEIASDFEALPAG